MLFMLTTAEFRENNMTLLGHEHMNMYPAGIWCENDVVLTSMRRDYVASTLIRRHFDTKCPLGSTLSFAFWNVIFCQIMEIHKSYWTDDIHNSI